MEALLALAAWEMIDIRQDQFGGVSQQRLRQLYAAWLPALLYIGPARRENHPNSSVMLISIFGF